MKEIFAIGSQDNGNNNEVIDKFELCKLRDLSLSSLPQLARFYSEIKIPVTSKKRWKELTTESQANDSILEEELDTPTSLFNNKVVFPNLEKLSLYGINSEYIWGSQFPKASCCYQNLTRFTLWGCERLQYAFPSSIVRSFKQLQHLEINNCTVLKEIVAKLRDDADAASVFVFPRLTNLYLRNLPNLETFYPRLHTLELPVLKELDVVNLEKIKVLSSDYTSSYENNKEDHLDISRSQSFFLVEKINPNVEKLRLGGKSIAMIRHSQFPENYLRFKVIELVDDESTTIPFGALRRFSNMEKLKVRSSRYKEIFSCEEYDKCVGMLKQLKVLELHFLFDLKYVVELDSKLNSVLQNLEILEVRYCDKLIKLVPSSASFQNLTAVKVSSCDGLMKLVTPATAKSFGQLIEMNIERCKMVKEIVANEGDVEKEIVFIKLKRLSLITLRSLKSFCSGNYTLKFPTLEHLVVEECPKMKTFCKGVLSTPRLQEVKSNRRFETRGCWVVDLDLNTTIQQLHKTLVTSMSEQLTLSGDDIRIMLEGQFSKQYSCSIKVLEVIEDESMNIPLGILHRFNDLKKLIITTSSYIEIFSCELGEKQDKMLTQIKILELWGLSNLTDMWRQHSKVDSILPNLEVLKVHYCHNLVILLPSLASFESLTTLIVSCCNGMRDLVTSSTAKSLVQLKELTIEHCEVMVEVVANEEDVAKDEVVSFRKLKSLQLWNLESLTSFCSGNSTFKFPSLEGLEVTKCPNMKTFSEGILSTPKLQKVSYGHWGRSEECWKGDLNATMKKLYKKVNNLQSYQKELGETSIEVLN